MRQIAGLGREERDACMALKAHRGHGESISNGKCTGERRVTAGGIRREGESETGSPGVLEPVMWVVTGEGGLRCIEGFMDMILIKSESIGNG